MLGDGVLDGRGGGDGVLLGLGKVFIIGGGGGGDLMLGIKFVNKFLVLFFVLENVDLLEGIVGGGYGIGFWGGICNFWVMGGGGGVCFCILVWGVGGGWRVGFVGLNVVVIIVGRLLG